MWWADIKAAIGQRINLEGISCAVGVITKDRHLLVPHVSVPDIRYIDWGELKRRGFQGVVFDKDNTLTVPYSLGLWEPLKSSVDECKSVFGNNIAVFSNSAGNSLSDMHVQCVSVSVCVCVLIFIFLLKIHVNALSFL